MSRINTRRRRVILDGSFAAATDEQEKPVRKSGSNSGKRLSVTGYSEAGTSDCQPRTTDLVPTSKWLLAGIAVAGCAVIVFINLLSIKSPAWFASVAPESLQAFSWSGVGNLSSWFSSLLLLITSMASLQIYAIRRHRCDDYNGTYQVWVWMAVLFVLASINCVVDFRSLVAAIAESFGYSSGRSLIILMAVKMVALTAIVVRGVIEIRASRGALAAVGVVWIAYASAILLQMPTVSKNMVSQSEPIYGNSLLVGTLATLVCSLTYLRFVVLQANGKIVAKTGTETNSKSRTGAFRWSIFNSEKAAGAAENERLREDDSGSSSSSGSTGRRNRKAKSIGEAEPTKTKRRRKASSEDEQKSQSVETDRSEAVDDPEILKLEGAESLSKSERRRLRKLQKRQRRAA